MRHLITKADFKLLWKVGVTYLFSVAAACFLFSWLNHQQMIRLAKSYAESSRHNIVIGDLRQVVTSLLPATEQDFGSITFVDSSARSRLDIPNDGALNRIPWLAPQIEVPIQSDPKRPHLPAIGSVIFRYSFLNHVVYLVVTSLIMLITSVLIYFLIKRRVSEREQFKAKQAQVEFQTNLTMQVAHDIRSPLSALNMIIGRSTGLPMSELILIERISERINEIANDLLAMNTSRENGFYGQHENTMIESHNLYEIVRDIMDEKSIGLTEDRLSFVSSAEDTIHIICRFDRIQIARTLSNLINNALEAISDGGNVTVGISSSGDRAIVQIMDDGCGIPTDVLQKLGKSRISFGKGQKLSGSGLGVLHAQETINNSGGTLQIESREGRGTLVTIRLPIVR